MIFCLPIEFLTPYVLVRALAFKSFKEQVKTIVLARSSKAF